MDNSTIVIRGAREHNLRNIDLDLPLKRMIVELMTTNHLPTGGDLASMGQRVFSETSYEGIGFGLGVSVMLDPVRAAVIGSPGEYAWGGAGSPMFWIDPRQELVGILETQIREDVSGPLFKPNWFTPFRTQVPTPVLPRIAS